jgi:signal transduction histidine kinase
LSLHHHAVQQRHLVIGADIAVKPFSASRFVVAVTDTGIGIKPEDLSRLFTKFEQLETGAARHYGGTISVESNVGKGSRFSVVLPLTAAGEST